MFTSQLKDTITVSRLATTTGIKREYTTSAPIPCMIQPLDAEKTLQHGLTLTKAYRCYADIDADIDGGDKVVDQLGQTFVVSGVEAHNYGSYPHLEIVMQRQDDQ